MREYSGLKNLRNTGGNMYCPKCGNYLEVVSNGFFHGELFYCKTEKKVFSVQLKDITKQAGKEYLEQCEQDIEVKELRGKINRKNVKEVKEILSPKLDKK